VALQVTLLLLLLMMRHAAHRSVEWLEDAGRFSVETCTNGRTRQMTRALVSLFHLSQVNGK
jgi:hypothetical protein